MNIKFRNRMAYENKHNWTLGQNKPNSNPIFLKARMNANVFVRKDYENKTAFRLQQNKPNQTQSVIFSKLVPAKAGILCPRMKPKLSSPASKLEAIYLRIANGKKCLSQLFYCQGGNAKKS